MSLQHKELAEDNIFCIFKKLYICAHTLPHPHCVYFKSRWGKMSLKTPNIFQAGHRVDIPNTLYSLLPSLFASEDPYDINP